MHAGKCRICKVFLVGLAIYAGKYKSSSDSAGHMLGGCLHRHAKGMIVKRHNQATWEIYNATSAGNAGNNFTIIDAGTGMAMMRS